MSAKLEAYKKENSSTRARSGSFTKSAGAMRVPVKVDAGKKAMNAGAKRVAPTRPTMRF